MASPDFTRRVELAPEEVSKERVKPRHCIEAVKLGNALRGTGVSHQGLLLSRNPQKSTIVLVFIKLVLLRINRWV
jgi:hypothetical protein